MNTVSYGAPQIWKRGVPECSESVQSLAFRLTLRIIRPFRPSGSLIASNTESGDLISCRAASKHLRLCRVRQAKQRERWLTVTEVNAGGPGRCISRRPSLQFVDYRSQKTIFRKPSVPQSETQKRLSLPGAFGRHMAKGPRPAHSK